MATASFNVVVQISTVSVSSTWILVFSFVVFTGRYLDEMETIDLTSDIEESSSEPFRVIEIIDNPSSVSKKTSSSPEPKNNFAKPWWSRMPYFVPVAAIERDPVTDLGIEPKFGSMVYVDYLNQFHTEQPNQKLKTKGRRSFDQKMSKLSTNSTLKVTSGEWTFGDAGKKVFRTSDGKEYSGMKAYEMHAKIADKVKTKK